MPSPPCRLIWLACAIAFACVGCEPGEEAATEEVAPAAGPAAAPAEAVPVDEEPLPPAPPGSLEERIRDQQIATRIRLALVEEPGLGTFDFEPDVQAGAVVLRGTVRTAEQRDRALAVARTVEGVESLENALQATEALTPDPTTVAVAGPEGPGGEEPEPEVAEPEIAASDPEAPSAEGTAAETEAEAPQSRTHTVASGESLWLIARRYDLTVQELRELNSLRSDRLRPGQELRVE